MTFVPSETTAARPSARDAKDTLRTVAVCGAFDMQNFGDLLFPVLAAHRLANHGYKVVTHAPTDSDPGLGLPAPRPVEALFDPAQDVDAVMIGGGYIVHGFPVSRFVKLNRAEGETDNRAELLDCWMGATVAAALRGVPVVWNAPGVPFPFSGRQQATLDAVTDAADYLSLRDAGSAAFLRPSELPTARIVPDPVAEISRIWTAASLAPELAAFRSRHAVPEDRPLLAIHVRDRSLSGLGPEGLARLIDAFAQAHQLLPVLIAVGDAHHDALTAQSVAQHMTGPQVVLNQALSLREIASVLAHARLYVGASLHGYIAASSYGVPGALVARPAYGKFDGYLRHLDRLSDKSLDWAAAFDHAAQLLAGPQTRPLPPAVFDALDRHWQEMRAALDSAGPTAASRSDFLRRYIALCVSRSGPAWLTSPFNATIRGIQP
ncbi:polysaccharide pyruvyl transferase family protein [Pseudooceanicola nanhaiensis]|uniref:polysaccharide pyruvyl transferase family protein n=1 Tax=Pseudooceanicola nanhaiensis TaxID=375761 RepID=UPI001CD7DF25|nr:polysaccharide pyruvyl transferase family protein [Pseudooceanicola nanhaiensis]MCA0920128.1 polysaccharide pyruvyl transferase family protein [Pseudooceanicola nanhaiensis]